MGLSSHPEVVSAAGEALQRWGTGSGSSRLVTGASPAHRDLKTDLARFLGAEEALLFPTGYQANLGLLTALACPDDLIASDAANHASIIDGCRLSRARVTVYPHCDVVAADRALATPGTFRRRFLVTESIFSMDGDRAPLAQLADVARTHDAALLVDEAHALGVAGPGGRGLAAAAGVAPFALIGTLGKALGSLGGFVAGSADLRALLINRSRPFIYTTAGPPVLAHAARAALALASGPRGDDLRAAARSAADLLRLALRATHPEVLRTADLIVPCILGGEAEALEVSARLADDGLLVTAIRPPTVPAGTARLRLTTSASHDPAEVNRLISALARALPPTRDPR